MPPINLHKDDPINPNTAAKADGITPQTATDTTQNPPPTRTLPASISATTTADPSAPPAPQPGARPLAPTAHAHNASDKPLPPQAGGYTATHTTTETRLAGPPPQYHIPPPTDAQLAGRSTVPSTQASGPGPTRLDMGPAQPGASPFQYEHRGGREPRNSLEGPPGYQQAPDNSPYAAGGGPMGTGGVSGMGSGQSADGGVGGAAWNMLAQAGEALKKGEEAVWKALRDK